MESSLTIADYQIQYANDFSRYVPTFVDKTVLVVGCGEGQDCSFFVDFGAKMVYGLDIVPNIGALFQHERVQYVKESADRMPFANDSFDYVYSVATMEHIHKIDLAFAEMVRVCRPEGIIYCIAAPLWNSREGHHYFGLFSEYPWIHLRLSKKEILEYCYVKGIKKGENDISDDIDFMFSDYFNFLPAQRYLDVCSKLPVSKIISNSLWLESEEYLQDDVFRELELLGYTKQELLAVSHIFIAQK